MPLQAYINSAPRTRDGVNEAMDDASVRGLAQVSKAEQYAVVILRIVLRPSQRCFVLRVVIIPRYPALEVRGTHAKHPRRLRAV